MREHPTSFRCLVVVLLAALLAAPVAAQEAPYCPIDVDGRVAHVVYEGSRVYFEPLVDYERLVLTVTTPCSIVIREFERGENPIFDVREAVGELDGSYSWELRVVPFVDPAVRKALEQSREGGDPLTLLNFQQKGLLPQGPLVDSAAFTVLDGAIVPPESEEGRGEGKSLASQTSATRFRNGAGLTPTTAADQVIPDDLIVQGSACVGFDCVNNESFGFDTIRLKENNTRIQFNDTSSSASYPTNNWQIRANSSANGGANFLGFLDQNASDTTETGTLVFAVEADAGANALYVDSTGRVGFGTSTPVLDLHVSSSNTPSMRLEQTSAGGFTAQTWDVAGNEANFFVRDVTGGSLLPFRIRPGAPTSSLDISADGDVGIGTASPDARLEVVTGAASVATVRYTNTNASGFAGGEYFEGATQGLFVGLDNANNLARINAVSSYPLVILTNSTERIRFPAPGGNFITATNGAVLNSIGQWVDGSSRELKQNVAELSPTEAMAALAGLTPVTFAYKAAPGEVQAGFIAEDVPELVAQSDRKGLSSLEIVAVLTKVVQQQQATIEELEARLDQVQGQQNQD